ncbi:MAG: DUF1499 domain-containing protein [Pseudomonadales bacterium]|nr:DUF1499 domain-containing protein [Pseudomonadales bacterium]
MADSLRWWSKVLIAMAVLAIAILLSGPISYKSGLLPLQPALLFLIVSLSLGGITLLLSVIMLVVAQKNQFERNRNVLVAALIICCVPVLLVGGQLRMATSVPEIHDISTDTSNPPEFQKIVALRKDAKNSLVYEYQGSAEKLAEMQIAAYPEVKRINSVLSVSEALERSTKILSKMGLEIVNVDTEAGIVEATDTTFWFGFKDDMVIRIVAGTDGTAIDLRSVSRVGISDVGVNAARIMTFTKLFQAP